MASKSKNRLVVGDAEWAKDLPGWLLDEIREERLMLGLGELINPDCTKVGDAEMVAYFMTLSARQPLSSDDTKIYLYLATRVLKRRNIEVPEDIKVEELTDWELRQLEEWRERIYHWRGGEIDHPLLNAMRQLKREILRDEEKRKSTGQTLLYEFRVGA